MEEIEPHPMDFNPEIQRIERLLKIEEYTPGATRSMIVIESAEAYPQNDYDTVQEQSSDINPNIRREPHSELSNKIIDFLTSLPGIYDANSQKALVSRAGLDSRLQNQIDFSGPSAQFFQLLVDTLIKYGSLYDGRNAFEAVLEATKSYEGRDRQEYCERLIQELHTIRDRERNA